MPCKTKRKYAKWANYNASALNVLYSSIVLGKFMNHII